ncbi:MAG: hypothetical protein LBB22_03830 [Treponema sp.]|jgi:hypothetical protein|nr:hypothetical protein [Treponema sp.]
MVKFLFIHNFWTYSSHYYLTAHTGKLSFVMAYSYASRFFKNALFRVSTAAFNFHSDMLRKAAQRGAGTETEA